MFRVLKGFMRIAARRSKLGSNFFANLCLVAAVTC
jgi:hypothetical protein